MKFVIEHLSKSFEKKEVLRDIDFTFDEGKIYGLLGRNGAGKTTLFNCLNRDLKADSGNFYIEDENGQHIQKEFVGSKSKKETEAMLRHTAIASVYFYFLFEKICFANT